MCFYSLCVARAAGKPTLFLGGAGCELPYSQLETSALAELGGLQAPSVCRLGPLVAPAQATALGIQPNSRGGSDVVRPRCRLSPRGTRILRSAGAPQASLEPSPVPQALSALCCAGIWVGDKRGRCFSSSRQLSFGSGMEGVSRDLAPLFLGREHDQRCWAPSPPSRGSGSGVGV